MIAAGLRLGAVSLVGLLLAGCSGQAQTGGATAAGPAGAAPSGTGQVLPATPAPAAEPHGGQGRSDGSGSRHGSGDGSGSGAGAGGAAASTAAAADVIRVGKCWTNATASTGGELLIQASSSDPTARILAYRPDGSLIGEVRNDGGGRYGGTVMPYQAHDPVRVTLTSSAGGTVTVPTGPFQQQN